MVLIEISSPHSYSTSLYTPYAYLSLFGHNAQRGGQTERCQYAAYSGIGGLIIQHVASSCIERGVAKSVQRTLASSLMTD